MIYNCQCMTYYGMPTPCAPMFSGAVFLVCYLLLGLDVWAAVLAVAGTAMILVHTIGSMAYLQIELNAVSMTNLVMVRAYFKYASNETLLICWPQL